MLKETSGGVEPRDVTEEAVNPMGFPSESRAVIRAIPDAWLRKTDLRASLPVRSKSLFVIFISDKVRASLSPMQELECADCNGSIR